MQFAGLPTDEDERIALLYSLGLLDTEQEPLFDSVTELVTQILGTPIALISLLDSDRQWFKSRQGLEVTETPRDISFCSHAILQEDVFVVENAATDERFIDNPLVANSPHVAFYAGAPLIMPNGKALGTLCAIDSKPRQITAQQQQQLKALADHVVQLFLLKYKADSLELIAKTKEEQLANIVHDIKNPMTLVVGYADILKHDADQLDAETTREYANEIALSTDIVMHLVNNLLIMSTLLNNKIELVVSTIDLRQVVESTAASLKLYFQGFKCTVELNTELTTAPIASDRLRIQQVLLNLLSNAAKYSFQDGDAVRITLTSDNDSYNISIVNKGPGIAPEDKETLFQRFKRLDSGGTIEGNGIGLSIARQLVSLLGGELAFTSEPGGETNFYFSLPRAIG